jgi:predicted transcriptional regulator
VAELAPSERELEILKVLWELGPATVRQVHTRMCPNNELAFNTVQTLLRIMDEKGLVAHRAQGRTFVYRAKHSRERVTARFVDRVFDGALDQLMISLVRARNTSPEELRELERLLSKARRERQTEDNAGRK